MIAMLQAWVQGLTARERLLLAIALLLVVLGGGGLLAFQSAKSYRERAAADLSAAEDLRADVARLADARRRTPATIASSDATPRGIANAAMAQFGLTPAQVEPDGPTGVRISLQPADGQLVYQWVEALQQSGLTVSKLHLVRSGEGGLVTTDASLDLRR